MISRLVFFFVGFITCKFPFCRAQFLDQGRCCSSRAGSLKAALESKSPADGGRDQTYGVEDGGLGQLLPIGRVVFCNSRSSLTPFGYVVTISAQCPT
jgi:hypothetical protein